VIAAKTALPDRRWRVVAGLALGLALLTTVAGRAYERRTFDDRPALVARVSDEVRRDIGRRAAELLSLAGRLARDTELRDALGREPADAGRLFARVEAAVPEGYAREGGISVYGADGRAVAWAGRPAALTLAPASRGVWAAAGPLGLRLVAAVALGDRADGRPQTRTAPLVVAERALSRRAAGRRIRGDGYPFGSPVGDVELRVPSGRPAAADGPFQVPGPDGSPLLELEIPPGRIDAARGRLRSGVDAAVALLLAVSLLAWGGSLLGRRKRAGDRRAYAAAALGLAAAAFGIRGLLWVAVGRVAGPGGAGAGSVRAWWLFRTPWDFLAWMVLLGFLVALAGHAVLRYRVARRAARRAPMAGPGATIRFGAHQVLAGAAAGILTVGGSEVLAAAARTSAIDLLRLSLPPWDPGRLATLAALLVLQAAAFWAGVLVLLAATARWRLATRARAAAALWMAAFIACAWWAGRVTGSLPPQGAVAAGVTVTAAALFVRRGLGWYRHGSQALRLGFLGLAVVVPSVLLYPTLLHVTDREQRHLVESQLAVQVMRYPQELQDHLREARREIDAIPDLGRDAPDPLDPSRPVPTDAAFALWRRTVLGERRLTSSVEIYSTRGRLLSRFALNFPEYTWRSQQEWQVTSCDWEVFGEAASFGAEERRMLHAERALCDEAGRAALAVVVHVLPDYSALPFISSQSPYFELFRGGRVPRSEGRIGGDVNLVVYGWGRTPLYTSSGRAWTLDAGLFDRLYRSRDPLWVDLERSGRRSRVYLANDRSGIYALDYPLPGAFDHLAHASELATLAALLLAVALAATAVVRLAVGPPARRGYELLREVRTSFSRKLFLAFVLAAIGPVVVLAVAIRTYVAGELRADVEAEAARTVAVARRVVEESLAAGQGVEPGAARLDDDAMVWISRVIDQDVNLFDGPDLVATSERDLFASGLLSTRVPERVYRSILLERLPVFVGADEILDFQYLTAAAPVRVTGRDTILTVPLALRQREIEREIDDLDEGVQLGAVAFILFGAALGFWMAQRIADPVQRLTRAARRIATGDLDTRVLVRSADELQRLVESFNGMAEELQRQRGRLERTNRLEAWAEMARQVAHDIKNPLTPIQLAAEHLRRVHRDRGEPLAPVLDSCVDAILTQVRLLRQLSSEFSGFATTPVAQPVPTQVAALIDEVLHGYRAAPSDRLRIEVDLDPNLPEIMADRTLVGRALVNIVENALHAMPGGGTLRVHGASETGAVVVSVSDTGVGMDEDALSRVFEPYFSTKAIGTGLGLTIARRNLELHGGSIHVQSRRGEGTTVTVRLPRAVPAAGPPVADAPAGG